MRETVSDLANWADLVLLDSPPLQQFADAVVLAPMDDNILLVVGSGRVSKGQVEKAIAQLTNIGVERIGYVFNRLETDSDYYRYQLTRRINLTSI